jgi:signal transduction histidine kinase
MCGCLVAPALPSMDACNAVNRAEGRAQGMASSNTHNPRVGIVAALSGAAVGVCAGAVALTLSGNQSSNPVLDAEIRAAIIALPIAVGLSMWRREPWTRFARLLVVAGFAWSLTTLAQSSNEVLYSAGRVFGWLVEPLLIFLVLAFPSGRLVARAEGALVASSLVLVALLYLPTMLLVESYPTPSPWTSCEGDCPANAFMLLASEPGFVGNVILPFREAATVLLFAGVIVVLAARVRRGTALMRITLVPVLAAAILHALAFIVGIVARRTMDGSQAAEVASWIIAISFAGVAVGFMIGLWSWRAFENRALRRVAAGLAAHPPALNLSETADLLSGSMDRSLEIVHRPPDEPNGWVDVAGRPVRLHFDDVTRCVTTISGADGRVVAVVHDAAFKDDPAFLDVARSCVLKALESERISADLRSSLRELQESRARIMASADRERQRIERDLHDGAQQSLVALRIRLELAGEHLRESPPQAERLLVDLGAQIDEALEQVRSLARGVYPSLLADRGLRDAIRAAGSRNPVRTTVDMNGVGRYSPEVETAMYFCCLEAMQNAIKHANGVETIAVSFTAGDVLRFEVCDDGAGFAPDAVLPGAGLANMRDRLAAVGGVLEINTAPGAGTSIAGTVPLQVNGSRDVSDTGASQGRFSPGRSRSPRPARARA